MKRVRSMTNPGVAPAKSYLIPNEVEKSKIKIQVKTLKGRDRKMIQDLCDYCLKPKYVRRGQLGLRLRGYKFLCSDCRDSGKGEFGEGKKNLPCW